MKYVYKLNELYDELYVIDFKSNNVECLSLEETIKKDIPLVGKYKRNGLTYFVCFNKRDYYLLDLIEDVRVSDKKCIDNKFSYTLLDDLGLIWAGRHIKPFNVGTLVGRYVDNLESNYLIFPKMDGGSIEVILKDNWKMLYTKLLVLEKA